jgi:CheY-like chemotaxis protein
MKKMPQQIPSLLVIEDSDEDFEALNRIIDRVGTFVLTIHRCVDGDDALDFLNKAGFYSGTSDYALPGLIILDLNLPGTDGREVLATIKQSDILKMIPVVVLSTSSNPKDVAACYQAGANSYLVKPLKIDELRDSVQAMLNYWFKVTVLPSSIQL